MYCRYSWEEYLESEGAEVQLSRYLKREPANGT